MNNADYQRAFRARQNERLERVEEGVEILRKEIGILRKEATEILGLLRKNSPILRKDNSAKSITSAETAKPRRKGASLIESNWILSLEERRFAIELGLDPDRTADEFRDYWIAKTGQGATKADWSATFRNWCRRAQSFGQNGAPPRVPVNGHDVGMAIRTPSSKCSWPACSCSVRSACQAVNGELHV